MKFSGWLLLTGSLIFTGMIIGCQQELEEPRLDTRNQQAFLLSLAQVRSQVDVESIAQFDQAIDDAQTRYQLQKQYSLLTTNNPLNGLTAQQILQLASKNQKVTSRRLHKWISI